MGIIFIVLARAEWAGGWYDSCKAAAWYDFCSFCLVYLLQGEKKISAGSEEVKQHPPIYIAFSKAELSVPIFSALFLLFWLKQHTFCIIFLFISRLASHILDCSDQIISIIERTKYPTTTISKAPTINFSLGVVLV